MDDNNDQIQPDNQEEVVKKAPEEQKEEKIVIKIKKNKGMDLKEFFRQDKHYFVMTDGGKPIYSRYGDEIKNSEIMATFSAIMTKFTVFNSDGTDTEKLNYISNDKSTIVFLRKGHLIFIAFSKTKDSISFLKSQLEFIYIQLLSLITSGNIQKLEDNPNNCLKILSDMEQLFEQMLELTANTMVSLISAYQVLPIENRHKLNEICNIHRGDALFCCILSPNEIIALSKSDQINLVASDVILLQNHLLHNEALRSQESWGFICLPGISDTGILQMYSSFEDPIFVIYITNSQEESCFFRFSEKTKTIIQEILEKKLMGNIKKSLQNKNTVHNTKLEKNKVNKFINKLFPESIKIKKQQITNPNINNDTPQIANDQQQDNTNTNINLTGSTIVYGSNTITNNTNTNVDLKKAGTFSEPAMKRISFSETVYKAKDSKKDPLLRVNYAIMKHKTLNQFFSINFGPFDQITEEEKIVYKEYGNLFDMYSSQDVALININSFFHIEKNNRNTHAILVNEAYILWATFNLFLSFEEVHLICKEITKIVKTYEYNFFINIK